MLAILHPAPASHFGMSSNHLPGKDEHPFGYTFTSEDINHAAAEEDVTAAGPPLLNDFQNTQLQNFFDQGPFNAFPNSFNFSDPDLQPQHDPSALFTGFDFYSEAPHTFHGTVSDANQASTIYGGLDRHVAADYAHNGAQADPSDEVIGAANALLASSQPQHDPTFAEKPWGNFVGLPSPPASAALTSASSQRNPTAPASTNNDNKASALNYFDQLNPTALATSSSNSSRLPMQPNFGSDMSFQGSGFMAPTRSDKEEVAWDRYFGQTGVLQPSDSGPNTQPGTQPSSPTLQKRRPSLAYATQESIAPRIKQQASSPKRSPFPLALIPMEETPAASDDESASDDEVSPGGRATKRRRTLNENRFPSRARLNDVTPIAASQRASSFSVASRPKKSRDSVDSAARKRAGAKQARENLSEEQKRNNHILSEQKRRNLIKQGFEELNDLVPGLKAGGFSKSSTLMEGAKFLESLVIGNQILRQALGEV